MPNPIGNLQGLTSREKVLGPWPCEACGKRSQFAEIGRRINRVFCRNESCRYRRMIDKRYHRIVENDGTMWAFDSQGNKWRIHNV